MYLRTPDSSVSNIILNLIPRDICAYIDLLYLEKGITNSEGLALLNLSKSVSALQI
uniref:Auxin response factor n=1 Tax=Rhizophora mucronata TaxID=61149 RepID=A0A2P2M9U6_RHIMU